MQLNEVKFDGPTPIDAYGPGFFRVAEQVYQGPIAMLPERVSAWPGLEDVTGFIAVAKDIDVLLVGLGAEVAHLPAQTRMSLENAGIGVEVMTTPAACRTFNVLLAEGRRISAALIPV